MSLIETLTQASSEIYHGDVHVQKLESMGGGASGADAYSILDKQGKRIGFVKIVRNKFNKGMS